MPITHDEKSMLQKHDTDFYNPKDGVIVRLVKLETNVAQWHSVFVCSDNGGRVQTRTLNP